MKRSLLGLTLVGLAVALLAPLPVAAALPAGSGSALTNRGDDARTGWFPAADAPSPAVVASSGFGQVFSDQLMGKLMAQPLEDQGVIIVATEADQIDGIDPTTGAVLWQRMVGVPVPSTTLGCPDISPQVGITSTPTVDPATGIVYFMADTMVGSTPSFQLHAIDPHTGTEAPGFPVAIAGRAINHPRGARFVAAQEYQRPALLLLDGVIYAAFGSHCDQAPWNGWISATTTTGSMTSLWSTQAQSTGSGIWQSGTGLSSDGAGSIFAAVGNGVAPSSAFNPSGSFGQSIVRLGVGLHGALTAVDDFSPASRVAQARRDYDTGSGGVVVLPGSMGSSSVPHLALGVSKSGELYLMDATHLGGVGQGPHGSDGILSSLTLPGRIFSTPAVVPGTDNLAYIDAQMSNYDYLSQQPSAQPLYAISITSTGGVSGLSLKASTPPIFGFGSGTPAVSTSTTDPAGGIVWISRCAVTTTPCTTASLDAFAASPTNGSLTELNSWPLPAGSKFAAPLIAGGRVYLGAGSSLVAFGQLPMSTLIGTFSASGPILTGGTSAGTLLLSATSPVTLLSVSSSSDQLTPSASAIAAASSSPQTSFSIPVAITPGAVPGELSATATVTTSAGVIPVEMSTVSQSPGPSLLNGIPSGVLYDYATCTMLEFEGVPRGSSVTRSFPLTNIGASPLTITQISGLSGPFKLAGPSLTGTSIAPGATLEVPITASGNGRALTTQEITVTTNDRQLRVLLSLSSAT